MKTEIKSNQMRRNKNEMGPCRWAAEMVVGCSGQKAIYSSACSSELTSLSNYIIGSAMLLIYILASMESICYDKKEIRSNI